VAPEVGGDPAAVGRAVLVSGTPSTILGVLPAWFVLASRANPEVWLPLRPTKAQLTKDAFNTAIISGRNVTVNFNSPTDQTVRNSQYLPVGTVDPNRLQPNNAGFGAANAWSGASNKLPAHHPGHDPPVVLTDRDGTEERVGRVPTPSFFVPASVPAGWNARRRARHRLPTSWSDTTQGVTLRTRTSSVHGWPMR
jgi:hypothetical protein